ncbi:MAG TPA: hypothetical protein VGR73_04275 [Bryobacteraceae bacterium]|nr:hypothetical protein [Bryobacteraceae bacterium]
MPTDVNQDRQQAYALLNLLSPEQLSAIRELLEKIVSPSEQISDDEERAVAEAKEWRKGGGKSVSHEEVLADFGLTMADFVAMGKRAQERRNSRE